MTSDITRSPAPDEALAVSAATPPTRDRYVDLIRAISITVVIFGHWLDDALDWDSPGWISNLLPTSLPLQSLTWLIQIMPLFFFVGGFSNALSLASTRRRGGGYTDFLQHRLERLLRPLAVFLSVWGLLTVTLRFFWPDSEAAATITLLAWQPLWFLAIYILAIALTPVTLAAHRRFGWLVPLALFGVAVVVDVARFGLGMAFVGFINLLAVWLLAFQLGYFYVDGRLQAIGTWRLVGIALAALAALTALTTWGPYPRSMVGTGAEQAVSNMFPPTLCIAVLTVWLVALAMLVRKPAEALAARPRVWTAVVLVNLYIMTLYLWHTSAWSVTALILHSLSVWTPAVGSVGFWLTRPLWLATLSLVLLGFVRVFGRFEQPPSIVRAAKAATAVAP